MYYTTLGTRAAAGGIINLSLYNAVRVNVTLVRLDNVGGNIGQITARTRVQKPWRYIQHVMNIDQPASFYPWPIPPDSGTVGHEYVSNAVMTIANPGLGPAVLGATRYNGLFNRLDSASAANLAGANTLTAQETAGLSWSWESWIYNTGNTPAEIYIETNNTVTSYLQITNDASGNIAITTNGVLRWTSTGGAIFTANAWHHYALAYNSGAGTVTAFKDGAVWGTSPAYARQAYTNTSQYTGWNRTAAGINFVALGATYGAALTANDFSRHYTEATNDAFDGLAIATGANIPGSGGTAHILYSDKFVPGFDATRNVIYMPLAPLAYIQANAGVYYVEMQIIEPEGFGA